MSESKSSSLRRALLILSAFPILGVTPLCIGCGFGRGWQVLAAIVCFGIWLVLRLWRLGNASLLERFQVRVGGMIGLAGFNVDYLVVYYRL